MQRHLRRPGIAIRVAATPRDLDRMRAAMRARRGDRPLVSTKAGDALRRHVDVLARGDATSSIAAKVHGRLH